MKNKICIFAVLLSVTSNAGELTVSPEDISTLFPFPKTKEEVLKMMSFDDKGAHGPLLSAHLKRYVPTLDVAVENEKYIATYRVTSMRLDPCFKDSHDAPDSLCQPQVRFVFQPIIVAVKPNSRHPIRTHNATAMHVFYSVTSIEFRKTIEELVQLRHNRKAPPGPQHILGVHSILQIQRYWEYYAGIKKIALSVIGSERISRIAFINEREGHFWGFGSYEINKQVVTPRGITGIIPVDEKMQAEIRDRFGIDDSRLLVQSLTSSGSSIRFFSILNRPGPGHDNLFDVFSIPYDAKPTKVEGERFSTTMNRVENPTINSTETTDCVSCHMAQSTRAWIARTQTPSMVDQFINPIERSLEVKQAVCREISGGEPNHLDTIVSVINFGYSEVCPKISQRTLNETYLTLNRIKDWN